MKIKIITLFSLVFLVLGCGESKNSLVENTGIQLYSLRNQFENDIPGTLETIQSWGIEVIEGGENTYGMDEDEFILLLKDNNIKTVSVGTNLLELKNNPQETIRRANAFGAKYAMCPWIEHDGDNFTFEDTKNALAIFNEAGKLLKENDITLVYHPHGYEFRPYENGTLFDYMAKNAINFDFEMDVYWVVHGGENPMTLFERYPDKFKLMHLKDMKKGTKGNNTGHGNVEDNVILGTGMIDIKSLVLKGQEFGVEYMFIEDESSRVVQQVPSSLAFLKSL